MASWIDGRKRCGYDDNYPWCALVGRKNKQTGRHVNFASGNHTLHGHARLHHLKIGAPRLCSCMQRVPNFVGLN